jgi:hypothetical protein
MNDKELYEIALKEFELSRDESLWLKSKVECLGDEGKAKYLYIKLRVEELNSKPSSISQTNIDSEDEKLVHFLKKHSVRIEGSLQNLIESKFCEIINTKNFDKVLCDLFINSNLILLTASGKDRKGFAIAGLVLTGGAGLAGMLGLAAGNAIGKLFDDVQNNTSENTLKDFKDILIMNPKKSSLNAYDYRTDWDLGGGEWQTRICLKGEGIFNGEKGDVSLIFTFEGKTYDRTFMVKPNNKVPELANTLALPIPQIKQETKFIW